MKPLGSESKLRETPDNVRHHCSDKPGPPKNRTDEFIHCVKRATLTRESYVRDRTEHHDPENHCERLEPHQVVFEDHPEEESTREGASSERDRCLKPARAGLLRVILKAGAERLRREGFELCGLLLVHFWFAHGDKIRVVGVENVPRY